MPDLLATLEYCVKLATEPASPARARMLGELAALQRKAALVDAYYETFGSEPSEHIAYQRAAILPGPGWCRFCDSPIPGIHDADCPRD